MASISATVGPFTRIVTRDTPNETYGHIAVLDFDGICLYLGGFNRDKADAEIVASAGQLIDALAKLRDSAAARIAAAVDVSDMAPGEIVEAYGR